MSTTVNLGITKLDAGLRQPEIVINNALDTLDAMAAPKAARVYHDANQSIANDTPVPLNFNQERYDNDAIHDTSTNNTRLVCKTAGKYLIVGTVSYAFHATGYRDAAIRMNGSTYLAFVRVPAVSSNTEDTIVTVATIYTLAVNDYVELMAKQTSGGSLNVKASANYSPEFMLTRLSV